TFVGAQNPITESVCAISHANMFAGGPYLLAIPGLLPPMQGSTQVFVRSFTVVNTQELVTVVGTPIATATFVPTFTSVMPISTTFVISTTLAPATVTIPTGTAGKTLTLHP
ncbi:hypothetical protein HDU76_008758, partial [Blyttiomyces sp. JEL0837]